MGKRFRSQIFFGVITLLAIIVAFSYSTYAWFTLTPDVNVEPMRGTVGDAGTLQISNQPDDGFGVTCELTPVSGRVALKPVSTADLQTFYKSTLQNREGISIRFADCTDEVDERAIHGVVYLRTLGRDCSVLLDLENMYFGEDPQALAAMRLGLRCTTAAGDNYFILRLDELVQDEVESLHTVEKPDSVVSGLYEDGAPIFRPDDFPLLSDYGAKRDANGALADQDLVLFLLEKSDVARVEYWLYLEGCDEHCINPVQERDVALQLGFAARMFNH